MNIYGHLRIFAFLFATFPLLTFAQHTRQGLLQPDYDTYNLKGWPRQITVVQQYATGDDINFQETYLFDSTGNLTEYRKRGFGGENVTRYPLTLQEILRNCRYTFDYDGDVLELRKYNQRGTLTSSIHYIYAEGGYLAQSIEYAYAADSGVVTKRTVSTYDKHERLKSMEQYTADELLLWGEKRKYDRRGNLVKRKQMFYHEEGVDTTVEQRSYTYDSHGNWTVCNYSQNGKHVYTIRRTIVYYGD